MTAAERQQLLGLPRRFVCDWSDARTSRKQITDFSSCLLKWSTSLVGFVYTSEDSSRSANSVVLILRMSRFRDEQIKLMVSYDVMYKRCLVNERWKRLIWVMWQKLLDRNWPRCHQAKKALKCRWCFENNSISACRNGIYQYVHATCDQKTTALLALDISAAFDSIDRHILLEQWREDFGVNGIALNWLTYFIIGRT